MKLITALLACTMVRVGAQDAPALKLIKTIPLPGVAGRFDHFALDVRGHRLFVAALGNDTLEVVDVQAGTRVHTVTGLSKPTGVVYLADADQIGVANGGEGSFTILDGASYSAKASARKLDDADNVRLDRRSSLLYVGYGSGAVAILASGTLRQTGNIRLPGHPESFQLEQGGDRLFVNVPDANRIMVVDRQKGAIAAEWPLGTFRSNFPMALDEVGGRIFVGCRHPATLLILDLANGRKVADVAVSGDTDDLFYDQARKRLYLSCGAGFVDVVDQKDADHCRLRERIPTRDGARTSLFSNERDEFYLAVPRRGGRAAEIRVYQPPSL